MRKFRFVKKKIAFAALWTVEINNTNLPSVETSWFLGAFAKLLRATISYPSVRLSAWNTSATTGRIFMKFDILLGFEKLSR
jgi:hypothetical protein